MDDKPVRKTDRLAIASLWLGILALFTSNPFIFFFQVIKDGFEGAMDYWLGAGLLCIIPFNMAIGLAGIVTGGIFLKRGAEDKSKAMAGIVLGGLAILLDLTCTVITGVLL